MNSEKLNNHYTAKALERAKKSTAKKRKVGAVIVANGSIIGEGFNHNTKNIEGPCEDKEGETLPLVVHAECAAIRDAEERGNDTLGATIYVTHQPCEDCKAAIQRADIAHTIIADSFMKFDDDKLRYDLIPPEFLESLAKVVTANPNLRFDLIPIELIIALVEVLTYGAKKYKSNNWKDCKDLSRFEGAVFRHFEAYRKGEAKDTETNLPHLAHCLTNVGFLLYLTQEFKKDVK